MAPAVAEGGEPAMATQCLACSMVVLGNVMAWRRARKQPRHRRALCTA